MTPAEWLRRVRAGEPVELPARRVSLVSPPLRLEVTSNNNIVDGKVVGTPRTVSLGMQELAHLILDELPRLRLEHARLEMENARLKARLKARAPKVRARGKR